MLNHPAIRRFLESPSRSSSPLNQGSETPSLVQSESESLSQQGDGAERDGEAVWREDGSKQECRPGRNTGKVSSSSSGKAGTFFLLSLRQYIPKFVTGYVWCAIVCWNRAKGDVPHFRQ